MLFIKEIWKKNVERKIDSLEFRIINKEKNIYIKNIKEIYNARKHFLI